VVCQGAVGAAVGKSGKLYLRKDEVLGTIGKSGYKDKKILKAKKRK